MADVLEQTRRLGHEVFPPIAARGQPGRLNRPLVKALGEHGLLEPAASFVAARGDHGEQAEMRGPAGRESLCADYPLRRGQAHRAMRRAHPAHRSLQGQRVRRIGRHLTGADRRHDLVLADGSER